MTDLRNPLRNGLRESGGPSLYRHRYRRTEQSAGLFACSPTYDCAVSFHRLPQLALSPDLSAQDEGYGSVKTPADTFAWSAFCENAAESRASRQQPTAKHAPDTSVTFTTRRRCDRRPKGWEHASARDSESGLGIASRQIQRQ